MKFEIHLFLKKKAWMYILVSTFEYIKQRFHRFLSQERGNHLFLVPFLSIPGGLGAYLPLLNPSTTSPQHSKQFINCAHGL
jgi:hypothetical protein